MTTDSLIEENMKEFGIYENVIRWWCKKYKMVFVMPEFIDAFDKIRNEAKQEVFKDLDRELKGWQSFTVEIVKSVKKKHLTLGERQMKYIPSDWSCGEHQRNFKTKQAYLSHMRSLHSIIINQTDAD